MRNTIRKFPGREDSRFVDYHLVPSGEPKFVIEPKAKIFTIGSCFARNIEEALRDLGFELPMLKFVSPKSEWPNRPNGLLNEYNPGTMSQRITAALDGNDFSSTTIVQSRGGFADLLLHGGSDVSFDRALERRKEIRAVYAELTNCRYLIMTLGLVEVWYDAQERLFLNRLPPPDATKACPDRFVLKVMDVEQSLKVLRPAMRTLQSRGLNVILTVSPVPMHSTFTGKDCVLANEYSKSVLRVCAHEIADAFSNVDYFPSYEIVRSGGLGNYEDDNVHVKDAVVREITSRMIKLYSGAQ